MDGGNRQTPSRDFFDSRFGPRQTAALPAASPEDIMGTRSCHFRIFEDILGYLICGIFVGYATIGFI